MLIWSVLAKDPFGQSGWSMPAVHCPDGVLPEEQFGQGGGLISAVVLAFVPIQTIFFKKNCFVFGLLP